MPRGVAKVGVKNGLDAIIILMRPMSHRRGFLNLPRSRIWVNDTDNS
jgi:hypothetical protein